jgi:hypothetical protein
MTEDLLKVVGYALIALTPYIYERIKSFLKNKGDYLSKNLKIRRQIRDITKEIRIHTEANRTAIFEFSNTEKSTAGFPFEFVTMTYEEVDATVVPVKDRFQKVSIGGMLDWFQPFEVEKLRFVVFQNDDPQVPDVVRFRMRELSISTIILFKITDKIKNGMLVLHFTHPYMEDWRESELVKPHKDNVYLQFQSNRIVQLMRQLKK